MGSNRGKEKYWNTAKIQAHMDEHAKIMNAFEDTAQLQQQNYRGFINNETFQGRTAVASKSYMEETEAVVLDKLTKSCVSLQKQETKLMEGFQSELDVADNAVLYSGALEKIIQDFQNLKAEFCEIEEKIEDLSEECNYTCREYGPFDHPDGSRVRSAFKDLAEEDVGYLPDLLNRFLEFDDAHQRDFEQDDIPENLSYVESELSRMDGMNGSQMVALDQKKTIFDIFPEIATNPMEKQGQVINVSSVEMKADAVGAQKEKNPTSQDFLNDKKMQENIKHFQDGMEPKDVLEACNDIGNPQIKDIYRNQIVKAVYAQKKQIMEKLDSYWADETQFEEGWWNDESKTEEALSYLYIEALLNGELDVGKIVFGKSADVPDEKIRALQLLLLDTPADGVFSDNLVNQLNSAYARLGLAEGFDPSTYILDLEVVKTYYENHKYFMEKSKESEFQLMSMAIDFLPGVGEVKAALEAAGGKDLITGYEYSDGERVIMISCLVVAEYAKYISRLSDAGAMCKYGDEVIEGGKTSTVLDYSKRFNDSLANDFNAGAEVRDVVQEDMILVQFSSDSPNASLRYWTTVDEANGISTIDEYMDKMALSSEWGNRNVVKVARVSKGTNVTHAIGTAKAQTSIIDPRLGNGKQILFSEFDSDWVTEVRTITN